MGGWGVGPEAGGCTAALGGFAGTPATGGLAGPVLVAHRRAVEHRLRASEQILDRDRAHVDLGLVVDAGMPGLLPAGAVASRAGSLSLASLGGALPPGSAR